MASLQDLADPDQAAMQPETYANPLVKLLLNSAANTVAAPGNIAKPNPYPAGTEEADWYDRQRQEAMVPSAVDLAGLTTLGAGAAPAEANSLRAGIKAYHGSPHDFDAFDLSKIGTGEGAQAYGHGLYFAGNEAVAKSYKGAGEAASRQRDIINGQLSAVAREMDQVGYTDPTLRAKYNDLLAQRDNLGRMYEVNINADPEHFLDWDKPLTQQSPQVQESLKKTMGKNWDDFKYASGGTAVKNGFIAPSPEGTAANLSGIPGIKYLDQGSRGAGEGSRNYVVFDDKLIDIVKKYGMAGLSMLPPATAAAMSQHIRPVDHDPFALTPVDHDPFEGT